MKNFDSKTVSAQIRSDKHPNAWKLLTKGLDDGESASAIVREALKYQASNDPSIEFESDLSNTGSSEFTIEVKSKTGEAKTIDPNDASAPIYHRTDLFLNPHDIDDWKEFEPVGGAYKTRRKYIYISVANYAKRESPNPFTRDSLKQVFQYDLGLSSRSAEDAIDHLIGDGLLFPHPSQESGVLRKSLLKKARLSAASAECEKWDRGSVKSTAGFSTLEENRFPSDWSEILHGYDKFAKDALYFDLSAYGNELINSIKIGVETLLNLPPGQKRHQTTTAMTNDEKRIVWTEVIHQLTSQLSQRFNVDISEARRLLSNINSKIDYDNFEDSEEVSDLRADFTDWFHNSKQQISN